MNKAILLADIVCGGLRQRSNKSFVHYAFVQFQFFILDLSKFNIWSRFTFIKSIREFVVNGIKHIDSITISIGNVDTKQVCVKNNILGKSVPNRYRQEKIESRLCYLSKYIRRLFEHTGNAVKSLCRRYSYIAGNFHREILQEEFGRTSIYMLDIPPLKTYEFILILLSKVEGELFSGVSRRFNNIPLFLYDMFEDKILGYFYVKLLAAENNYLLDQFHLNEISYQKIVSHLSECSKSIL